MEREDFFNQLLELNFLLLKSEKRSDIEAIRIMINHLINEYNESRMVKTYMETGYINHYDLY